MFALLAVGTLRADDFAALCAGRLAVERVNYNHRPGEKPPFEQVLPPGTVERLVQWDLRKESILRQIYGVEITPAKLADAMQRLNTTADSPGWLSEIKNALGNDPNLLAGVFVKPLLVDRKLHEIFDNDEALRAPVRRQAEQARCELLAAKTNGADGAALLAWLQHTYSNRVSELAWQLAPRPAETRSPAPNAAPPEKFGQTFNFNSLPAELQIELHSQLRDARDVSMIIETPCGYNLYLAKAKTDSVLSVARVTFPKCGYEQWLEEQSEIQP